MLHSALRDCLSCVDPAAGSSAPAPGAPEWLGASACSPANREHRRLGPATEAILGIHIHRACSETLIQDQLLDYPCTPFSVC